jgi:hypothetical protein
VREYRLPYRRFLCAKCGEEVVTQAPQQRYCSPACQNAASALRHYYRHRDRLLARYRAYRAAKRELVA